MRHEIDVDRKTIIATHSLHPPLMLNTFFATFERARKMTQESTRGVAGARNCQVLLWCKLLTCVVSFEN